MDFRLVKDNEKDQWFPLWQDYLIFYKTELADEITDLTWNRFLDKDNPLFCMGAYKQGKMIGFLTYLFHHSTWSKEDYCYLEDLFINPAHRGQNIAKKLIETVYQTAQNKGCRKFYWLTHNTNKAAQRLYDKMAEQSGFIQYIMPIS